ncbi:MAG TPA: prenyltransferase/squalene oxidase repeat-containing protein [Phycisphaerales bacterium]|nr:prenyltransferase/squalene oxidase repeat-containing protein [Phycisphaerales bacterium]
MRYAPLLLVLLAGCSAAPQTASPGMMQPERPRVTIPPNATPVTVTPEMKSDAITKGIAVILKLQQGNNNAEWPYEGVYRVRGQIPWGYRVGGTAICTLALVEAPGYKDDATRQEAVKKACKFICESRTEKDLSLETYKESYDVRSWGHLEAVATFSRMKQLEAFPAGMEQEIEDAMAFYLDALHKLEMPKVGGWNYARPGAPSTFMTARALQALFEAKAAGYTVDPEVVSRALAFLEKCKNATGAVMYAGTPRGEPRKSDGVPGATGRMCSVESTLFLAGRSNTPAMRGACDAFIVHWSWLNQRRVQTGTHVPPYGVAPYYFMFAHYYAATAAELLPASEREEYHRRINELLFSVRNEDGSWNDRVFERSAAYGTAMAMLAIMAPDRRPAAKWDGAPVAAKEPENKTATP